MKILSFFYALSVFSSLIFSFSFLSQSASAQTVEENIGQSSSSVSSTNTMTTKDCIEENKPSLSATAHLQNFESLKILRDPKGQLKFNLEKFVDGGSMDGKWATDEAGQEWFVKADPELRKELQTSAEVITSRLYELLGYQVPYTAIVTINGKRYSAAKKIEAGKRTRLIDDAPNTPDFRQLKIFAAWLADKDRLGDGTNNFLYSNGAYALFDFGGSLGSKSQGQHKENDGFPSHSPGTGSFPPTENLTVIWDWYGYNWVNKKGHPWGKITPQDVDEAVSKLAKITDEKIDQVVQEAKYSSTEDAHYIAKGLKLRRKALMESLKMKLFP